jgi:hypothetical protein
MGAELMLYLRAIAAFMLLIPAMCLLAVAQRLCPQLPPGQRSLEPPAQGPNDPYWLTWDKDWDQRVQ